MSARGRSVWIVNQYALPRGATGITRHGDLASVLRQHGQDVTVIASSFDNFTRAGSVPSGNGSGPTGRDANGASVTEHEGVRFVWLRTSAYRRNDARRVLNMVEFYARAVTSRLLRRVRPPDVVIGSSPHLLSGLAGLTLAQRHGARFVLELRDVWPDDLVSMGALREGSPAHAALTRLARRLEARADRIVTVPPKLAAHLESRGVPPERLLYLPNGVFLDGWADAASDAVLPTSLRTLLEACAGSFVVMYMGAHGQANGLHNVLDAAAWLAAERPDVPVSFVLVGAGQQKPELLERARREGIRNVLFHDPIPKAAVPVAARLADALMVHLALVETFDAYGRSPNKLYDYLAAGKPTLYSTLDRGTIVDAACAGLTFAPGDPRALADAVLRLASMPPAEREAMGRRGRAALEGQHDLAQLGARLAQLVEELAGEPRG